MQLRLNFGPRFRWMLKGTSLAAFLGLALGYTVFCSIFPNVSVPAEGEASVARILGLLAAAGVLAGLGTDDLPTGVLQGFSIDSVRPRNRVCVGHLAGPHGFPRGPCR